MNKEHVEPREAEKRSPSKINDEGEDEEGAQNKKQGTKSNESEARMQSNTSESEPNEPNAKKARRCN